MAKGARLIPADVTDLAAVERVCRNYRPDRVFHLAAQVDVRVSVSDPGLDVRVNVEGTVNLLEAARKTGAGGFVLASSCAVYGEPEPGTVPLAESAPPSSRLALRPGEARRRGLRRALPGAARPARREPALRQRLRTAPGRRRRGRRRRHLLPRADPGRQPAALRRRHPDPRLRLRRRRRRGAAAACGQQRPRGVQRRDRQARPRSSTWSTSSRRSAAARTSSPSRCPAAPARSTGWRSTHPAATRRSAGRTRPRSRSGCG